MRILLGGGVGYFQPNYAEDVLVVQSLLNDHTHATEMRLVEDGVCGEATRAAIRAF